MNYRMADLDKALVQDFGCNRVAARHAVARYLQEAGHRPSRIGVYSGDPIIIAEWIWGTKRYWREPVVR